MFTSKNRRRCSHKKERRCSLLKLGVDTNEKGPLTVCHKKVNPNQGNEYDAGRIVHQRACPVNPGDTVETLAARVFAEECEVLASLKTCALLFNQ